MFFGMFGSIFLLAQFFQTVQGYSPLRLGPADPAVDGDADLRRADRRRALRPDRRPAADGHRARAAGDRARLDGGDRLADDVRTRSSSSRSSSPASAWRSSSRRSRTSCSRRCGRRRRARRPAPTTRSASSAASSASPCSPRSSRSYGGYESGQAFVDGLDPAVWVGAVVVGLGAVAAFAIPRRKRVRAAEPALDAA